MRLVVTGGGTGGHVFPALEVARLAIAEGAEVEYFGSRRGQEVLASKKAGLPFIGFPSEPLYSLKTPRGWRGAVSLIRARVLAKKALAGAWPDVVFATGGYSSAPVVAAAQALRIPVVIHEQNSVPGRSNLLFAKKAFAVATTFHGASEHFEGCRVQRTGLPVRKELRDLADGPHEKDLLPLILAVGGSQGAQALNEAALGAAARMFGQALNWLHLSGKAHFESVFTTYEKLGLKDSYEVRPFLEGMEMGQAYARSTLAVARAGAGTLAELAAFRVPSVLVPYPLAHAAHQLHNAMEFEEMGAATVLPQDALSPAELARRLEEWISDVDKREAASKALAGWDAPDAASRILDLIREAASG